jgi:very-short-patch-repair endonuclease
VVLKEKLVRWQERRHRTTELARGLRQRETAAEEVLWEALRGRRLEGLEFRRQHTVGTFVLDFCCPDHLLAIEGDGPVHDDSIERDAERTLWLEASGYRVVRFRNESVLNDMSAVLDRILSAIREEPSHS